jgi:TRAP-type C4-dicarboxylate transport system permease large subunit
VPIERVARASMPFYLVNVIVLLIVAFFPQVVLWPAELLTSSGI